MRGLGDWETGRLGEVATAAMKRGNIETENRKGGLSPPFMITGKGRKETVKR